METDSAETKNIQSILQNAIGNCHFEKISIFPNDIILFQGDSITDSNRFKRVKNSVNQQSLGDGFVFEIFKHCHQVLSNNKISIFNKGISGNKSGDLIQRWDKDCIALKPNLLNVLIGVNDYWHKRGKNSEQSLLTYEKNYRYLISATKQQFPDIRLIICEPFILPNTSVVDNSWFAPFMEYQKIAKIIALENNAVFIPLQKIFNEAVNYAPENFWLHDGVHPSEAGVDLISSAWLHYTSFEK